MFDYERRSQPVLSRKKYVRRLLQHGGYATSLVVASLVLGVLGFHFWAGQTAIDAFLNASMLLGGMGPVGDIESTGGKLFASFFSLYAGLVFFAVAAILIAPVLHRWQHKFHL